MPGMIPESEVDAARSELDKVREDWLKRPVVEDTMPGMIPESEVDAARSELDKVREDWLKRPGVTALDVGFKFKDGHLTDELAIRVHVRRKLPREALEEHELFPERLGRFSVDVIEASYGPQTIE